jgi:hypothetical protein
MTKQHQKGEKQGKPPTCVDSINHVGEKKPASMTTQFE